MHFSRSSRGSKKLALKKASTIAAIRGGCNKNFFIIYKLFTKSNSLLDAVYDNFLFKAKEKRTGNSDALFRKMYIYSVMYKIMHIFYMRAKRKAEANHRLFSSFLFSFHIGKTISVSCGSISCIFSSATFLPRLHKYIFFAVASKSQGRSYSS